MSAIKRFDGINDGLRRYVLGDTVVFSVTTIIGKFLDEDNTGLKIWKRRNDGSGNNADHEHLLWYKTYRGTLCHYNALSTFEEHHSGTGMWGDGEREALNEMMRGPSTGTFDEASHDNRDVVYSILSDHGWVHSRDEFEHRWQDTGIMDVQRVDTEYFMEAFETICNELGVDSGSVITVEHFLINKEYGYGGQCDLVYTDPNGETVIADLKTSSGLRLKHRLQAVAYKHAVEAADDIPVDEIDRMEVWLINPENRTGRVHANYVPEHAEEYSWYTDEEWLTDPWDNFDYDSVEEQWEHFRELVEQARQHDK